MNPVSFSNPATALLNQVAINPQPLPPGEKIASQSLWGSSTPATPTPTAQAGGSSILAMLADDFCGTKVPGHHPGQPTGPSFPNLQVLQGGIQLQA